jgi:hypothetical protein
MKMIENMKTKAVTMIMNMKKTVVGKYRVFKCEGYYYYHFLSKGKAVPVTGREGP